MATADPQDGRDELAADCAADAVLTIDMGAHRDSVNEVLAQASELVRGSAQPPKGKSITNRKIKPGSDLIGAKLKNTDLHGADLRGAYLIAADLHGADLRDADLIGADLRDADLGGADLSSSLFLTQPQVNSATGDAETQLPSSLVAPSHWKS